MPALQQGSPSDPVGNIRMQKVGIIVFRGEKSVFLVSACPKPIADVVSRVAVASSLRNPFSLERWDNAAVRSGVPIFLLPSRGCRGSAAGSVREGPRCPPGGCTPAAGPPALCCTLARCCGDAPPTAGVPLSAVDSSWTRLHAPGRARCPSLTAALGRAALGLMFG